MPTFIDLTPLEQLEAIERTDDPTSRALSAIQVIQETDGHLEELRAARDQAIRDLRKEMSIPAIAKLLGVSKSHVASVGRDAATMAVATSLHLTAAVATAAAAFTVLG